MEIGGVEIEQLSGLDFDSDSEWNDFVFAFRDYCAVVDGKDGEERKKCWDALVNAIPEKYFEQVEEALQEVPGGSFDEGAMALVKIVTGKEVDPNPNITIVTTEGKPGIAPEAFWNALENFWTLAEDDADEETLNGAVQKVGANVPGVNLDNEKFWGWSPQQKVRYLTKLRTNKDLKSLEEVQEDRDRIKLREPSKEQHHLKYKASAELDRRRAEMAKKGGTDTKRPTKSEEGWGESKKEPKVVDTLRGNSQSVKPGVRTVGPNKSGGAKRTNDEKKGSSRNVGPKKKGDVKPVNKKTKGSSRTVGPTKKGGVRRLNDEQAR